jgi:hypothetical protein
MKRDGGLIKGFCAVAAVAALLVFGLDAEAQSTRKACKAKAAECAWVVPKKGKQRPYCRLKPARKARP